MTQEELFREISAWLDRLDEPDWAALNDESIDIFVEGQRLDNMRAAYDDPDMTYKEFVGLVRKRAGKRGAPPVVPRKDKPTFRTDKAKYRAARDFFEIRAGWSKVVDREKALEFAAQRHNVDVQDLHDLVHRGPKRSLHPRP